MLSIGSRAIWYLPWLKHQTRPVVITEAIPKDRMGEEKYRVKGSGYDCYAFRVDLEPIDWRQFLGRLPENRG